MNTQAPHAAAPRSINLLDPRLKALCDAYLLAAQVPGASIAVVVGDRGYHHAYGVKSIVTREPVTAHTAFNIGSCSKAFVSAAMASLVADKLVSWDDPISKFVPEFQLYDAAVTQQATLRDLSGNRLGISRAGLTEFGLDPSHSAEFLLENLRHTAPVCGLRERHTYVNGGHTANALAIGRITGKGFLPTLRERVLAPLGMSSTSGGAAARTELADQAGWHCIDEGRVTAIDTVYTDQYLGGGGMVCSGRDALQWLRLQLNGGLVDGRQVIARDGLLETQQPQIIARPGKDILSLFHPEAHMAAYGLGWAVTDLEGQPMVLHSGGDLGIASMTLMLPKAGIGIASYCNSSGRGTVGLPYALAACLLGLKPRDWKAYFEAAIAAATPPPVASDATPELTLELSRYAGVYSHPADGEIVIEPAGGSLAGDMKRAYRRSFTAVPVGGHRFEMRYDHPEWRGLLAGDKTYLEFGVEDGRAAKLDFVVGPLRREHLRHV
jgi:CubicO group peptidase (beta-lactamase class C family)